MSTGRLRWLRLAMGLALIAGMVWLCPSDPAAVAKWLANLPPATVSDDLIGAFLEGAVVKYPEYAAQWTQSVTDETRRQNDEVRVARQWLKTDRSAALKWIERLNLPTEIKP